jgi:predicted SprT family Zn-dependent metalloprotease
MTTQREARSLALRLMNQFGLLPRWGLGFDNARSRAGCTRGRERKITLSRHFVQNNSLDRIEQTIRHEIAHALVGTRHGHDKEWQAMAREVGHTGERCYSAADTVMPLKPWIGVCGCDHEWERHRLTERMRTATCAACHQPLKWRHR